MAAITFPSAAGVDDESVEVRGAAARAAAVRSRDGRGRGRGGASAPSLFAGDGRLVRPAPPARLTSVPLVAHDDLATVAARGRAERRLASSVAPVADRRAAGVAPTAPRNPIVVSGPRTSPARPSHVRLVSVPPVAPAAPVAAVSEPDRTARPAGSATASRPSPATYRRRRLVAAATLLGALLLGSWALGALGGGSLAASERRPSSTGAVELPVQPVSRSTYVVAAGDTLWSIARALQPEGDVRPVVDALAASRQGRPLEVGETIVLP